MAKITTECIEVMSFFFSEALFLLHTIPISFQIRKVD